MRITKWAPLTPIDTVFDRLNLGFPELEKLFEENQENGGRNALRVPRTNIHDNEDGYVFTMEMPGLSKADVEVQLEGESLVIKGTKTGEVESKGLLRREIRSAKFERTFNVGTDVDRDTIKARMENGLLTVTLPKTADKVGRKVQVD